MANMPMNGMMGGGNGARPMPGAMAPGMSMPGMVPPGMMQPGMQPGMAGGNPAAMQQMMAMQQQMAMMQQTIMQQQQMMGMGGPRGPPPASIAAMPQLGNPSMGSPTLPPGGQAPAEGGAFDFMSKKNDAFDFVGSELAKNKRSL